MATAVPATAVGGRVGAGGWGYRQIPEGQFTTTVYQLIRDQRYSDVLQILQRELQTFPKSRAALSLSAYCLYQQQDFAAAAGMYEKLVQWYADEPEYQLNLAQALFKAGEYARAQRAAQAVEKPDLGPRVSKLLAAINYEQDDLPGTRSLL